MRSPQYSFLFSTIAASIFLVLFGFNLAQIFPDNSLSFHNFKNNFKNKAEISSAIDNVATQNSTKASDFFEIVPSTLEQDIAKIDIDISKEPLSLEGLAFKLWNNKTEIEKLSVYDQDGRLLAGPVKETAERFAFKESIVLPAGKNTLSVRAYVSPKNIRDGQTFVLKTDHSAGTWKFFDLNGKEQKGDEVGLDSDLYSGFSSEVRVRGPRAEVSFIGPVNGDNQQGNQQKTIKTGKSIPLGTVSVSAKDSGESLQVYGIELTKSPNLSNANCTIKDRPGPVIIQKGTDVSWTIVCDIAENLVGKNLSIGIWDSSKFIINGLGSEQPASIKIIPNLENLKVSDAVGLKIDRQDSKNTIISAGGSANIGSLELVAGDRDVTIKSLSISIVPAYSAIESIKISGIGNIGSIGNTDTVSFKQYKDMLLDTDIHIQPGQKLTLPFIAKIKDTLDTQDVGQKQEVVVTKIEAVDDEGRDISIKPGLGSGYVVANIIAHQAVPVINANPTFYQLSSAGQQEVYTFSIQNPRLDSLGNKNKIEINKITLSGKVADFYLSALSLKASYDAEGKVPVDLGGQVLAGGVSFSGGPSDREYKAIVFELKKPVYIFGGDTVYFTVEGVATGIKKGATASFRIVGDASKNFDGVATLEEVKKTYPANFVWSSGEQIKNQRWSNGFLLPGLENAASSILFYSIDQASE